MSIAVQLEKEAQIVRLDGCVDIASAADLKDTLLNTLQNNAKLRIDVRKLQRLDVTTIQLLWAAKREAIKAERDFQIDGPWDAAVESQLHVAGLAPSRILLDRGNR